MYWLICRKLFALYRLLKRNFKFILEVLQVLQVLILQVYAQKIKLTRKTIGNLL